MTRRRQRPCSARSPPGGSFHGSTAPRHSRASGTFCCFVTRADGVDLDLSFGWTPFEHEALEARSDAAYGSVVAPMARAEDLVIFKAMAARPKDIEDAAALMLMHKEIDVDPIPVG